MKLMKGIGKNVLILGIVSALVDMSSEIIRPILPMFIAALGGGGIAIGLVGGFSDSIASFLKVLSGYWSDLIGKRKKIVISGYALSGAAKFLLAASASWVHVLVMQSLIRVGKGLREAPRDALISESVKKKVGGKAFGLHRALDTAGAILGGMLAFIFVLVLVLDFSTIILIAGVIAMLAIIPLFFVKEVAARPAKRKLLAGLGKLPKNFRIFVLASSIYALANFSYMFFILRAQELFVGIAAVALPILLYVFANVFYASASIPAGMLSDKIGRKGVILAGYLLTVLVWAGFALWASLPLYIMLFAAWGLIYGLVDGNQRALAADIAPKAMKGTTLGTFHTAQGLAMLPASIIAGFLWELSPSYPFIYGAAFALLASMVFMVGFHE